MTTKKDDGLSADEKAAVKQAAAERRKTAKGENGEPQLLEAIAELTDAERPIGEGLYALCQRIDPTLTKRTWYGFPAWARGKDVLFWFQPASKFKARYGTLGFGDKSSVDEGDFSPVAFKITAWNAEIEKQVETLVRRALGM